MYSESETESRSAEVMPRVTFMATLTHSIRWKGTSKGSCTCDTRFTETVVAPFSRRGTPMMRTHLELEVVVVRMED